jgi:hypothetical protein
MKAHVLSFLPYGTLQNIARFVSTEFNEIVLDHVYVDHVHVEKSGVVTGGLTETEFTAMCERKSTTASGISVLGDLAREHGWTFQDIERVMLSTTWRNLTTLVIHGKLRHWNEDALVGALRGGDLRRLKCLKLVQRNPIHSGKLGGWHLPDVRTLALNVGWFRELLEQNPNMRPFEHMTRLDNLQLMNLEATCLYQPEFVHPLTSFLEAVLVPSVRYLRIEAYPTCFKFGAMTRVFHGVEKLSVEGHMLKSCILPTDEPSALVQFFPDVRMVFVVWDVRDVHLPPRRVGAHFVQHVRGRLGAGWVGRTHRKETAVGMRVKSALFERV